MLKFSRSAGLTLALLAQVALATFGGSAVQAADEKRFALVIGNSEYPSGALPTAANDAGLIAQTLQAAGFDVIGARDLDGDSLRRTFRDFTDKVSGAGPGAVAFVYLAGHGLQYEGENYLAGVDSKIDRDVDVPAHALRVSDFTRPLAALKPKALVVVLDAARENPFAKSGNPLAGGLALVEPSNGTLFAFNAAPGTIAPADVAPYGVYAQALAEMIREGGLPPNTLFDRVRLRVNDTSKGASLPWDGGKIDGSFVFFERAPDAPKVEASHIVNEARAERPISEFSDADDAYFAALERDTLQGYLAFLDAYPDARQAKRVRAIVAARREAITWRRTRSADTPNAYWTYLDRYSEGPHAWDARRRLDYLTAPLIAPVGYRAFDYDDLPPPPPDEYFYIRRRPVFYFYDPVFAFYAPPPCPIFFLPPPPPPFFFIAPPRPLFAFVLPVPVFVPVAVFVRPAPGVFIPSNNTLAVNIHQTITPVAAVTPGVPGIQGAAGGRGTAAAVGAGIVAGAAVAAAAHHVSLPPSLAAKAALNPATGAPLAKGAAGTSTSPATALKPLPQALGSTNVQPKPGNASILKPLPQALGSTNVQPKQGNASILKPQKQGTSASSAAIQTSPKTEARRENRPVTSPNQAAAQAQAQANARAANLARANQAARTNQSERINQARQSQATAARQQAVQASQQRQRSIQATQSVQSAQPRPQPRPQQQQAQKPRCGIPGTPACK